VLVEEEDETHMRPLIDIIHLFIVKLLLSYIISTSPNNFYLFITKVVIICVILFLLPKIMYTFPLSFILFHNVV
jgi:hypothetical protein